MARLKLFLACILVLWFTGRSPAYAQTGDDDSNEGSGNVSINGDMSILDCCKIFIGDGACYEQCVNIHNTPPSNWLDPILRNCSSETFTNYERCIISFSTVPTSSTSATTSIYSCCEEAHTENCTRECQRLIVADGDRTDNFLELVSYCGDVSDIVICILRNDPGPSTNATPTPLPPADLIRRRCCHTAVSDDCRTDCLNFYADITNEAWEAVETNCVHRPTEGKLASCLADVSSACKLGCSDMEFCRTFNNRPNQLFRKCVPDSDDNAKFEFHQWESTRIFDHLLTPELRLKNISQCLPEMWKVL